MKRILMVASAALVVASTSVSRAEDTSSSCAIITRANVVRCAEAASLAVRDRQKEVDVAEARRVASSPLLPTNPVVTFTAARRSAGDLGATNLYGTLAQEIEIAGQRGLRREAAAHAATAARKRVTVGERDVAADALVGYFDHLAATEVAALAARLEATGRSVAVAARARAESGVSSALEADVAESAAISLTRARLAAERDARDASLGLGALLGRDPAAGPVQVEGVLEPLPAGDLGASTGDAKLADRPEIEALDAERRALETQASALRRARIPNPTLQVYVQNDGFDERVLGGGVSLPVPLPYPLGRTNKGEIAEAEARADRLAIATEAERRELRRRVATAAQSVASLRAEAAAFTPDRLARAERTLTDIATEIGGGRLAVRDAVLGQQALIELLRGAIEARRALCVASVELARAAGLPLERGVR